MGSLESKLPAMAGNENENTPSEIAAAAQQQMEEQPQQQQQQQTQQQRRRQQRRQSERERERHESETYTLASTGDDPWWWEVENENLILDQVPNVTAVFDSESENDASAPLALSDDFRALLKIDENVAATTTTTGGPHKIESENANENEKNADALSAACEAITPTQNNNDNDNTDDCDNGDTRASSKSTLASINTREQTLDEFKEELRVKRLARQTAVQDLREEITTLRKQLASEQALTRRLRSAECIVENVNATGDETAIDSACATPTVDADDEDPMSRGRHANIELASAQLQLQLANSENISLRAELDVVKKQVGTLKEVIACCKQMLAVKEEQCTQLKGKLEEIETSFGERELKIMSDNLRQEYERQLGNIRQLRQLYEERQRVAAAEHENLQRLISIKRDELQAEQEKTKNFIERNQTLMKEVESANNELATLREECNEHKFEKKSLKEEMGAVNTLFSQMVMGFNGKNNLDIDRLTEMLEENRTLLNDMATKETNCSDGATLPKLLFELVEQAAVASKVNRSPTPNLTTTYYINKDVDGDEDDVTAAHVAIAKDNDDNDNDEDDVKDVDYATAPNSDAEVDVAGKVSLAATINAATHAANEDAAAAAAAETSATAAVDIGATAICEQTADAALSASNDRSGRKQHRKHATSNSNNSKSKMVRNTLDARTEPTTTLKFNEPEVIGKVASAQEIIGNLPKVWKVLMELLSHHKIEQVQFEENGAGEDCYKSVQTPNGPKAELSVSKTYIKLKDLILEKKSLVKETNRLKMLNSHLDYRLNEQEKRLSAVSLELTKTWHLVGKMQRQHRQLHTQEQILRYQLQQKRRLLTELKDELEYCRRKWAAARAKNDESQEQCNDLRREFAKRKLEDANMSGESGYSDSGPPSDEEERTNAAAAAATVAAAAAVIGNGCRRNLQEMFEHTRKIKRMQSTSPERAIYGEDELVLRWNSAPPTCGWRRGIADNVEHGDDDDDDDDDEDPANSVEDAEASANTGAIPKNQAHVSRRNKIELDADSEVAAKEPRTERATRIEKLEEQCKSLIRQVLETSDNRERLEVQLCRFQDEIAPVQYAVPLDEYKDRKCIERMMRASSAPATGTLTPREEEYTRKRSERLERLEEESRQLMSRIKRTSDRGHYLRCSLDRIRRAPSREGSFESNTEEEVQSKVEEKSIDSKENEPVVVVEEKVCEAAEEIKPDEKSTNQSPLTAEEEAYTARRAARLQRLEEESKQLLTRLSRNNERGGTIGSRLDTLQERYGNEEAVRANKQPTDTPAAPATIEQRIENIEKISTNREERLRILEEEGKQLLTRLSNTSERGTQMINRIAERELSRQARCSATPSSDDAQECTEGSTKPVTRENTQTQIDEMPTAATALMPMPKNVASTSIVSEELSEGVTVTATPSHFAQQHGAVPKSKPTLQLCAARPKHNRAQHKPDQTNESDESLEEMVRRLKELPFDEVKSAHESEQKEDLQVEQDSEVVQPVEAVESVQQRNETNSQRVLEE